MNWMFPWSRSGSSDVTPLQLQRGRQLESMRRAIPMIIESERDAEFRIPCIFNGSSCEITVFLPPQFPQERPMVRVRPLARHPWLDVEGRVIGCPSLNAFTLHADLGKVLQKLLKEFRQHPPIPLTSYPVFSTASGFTPTPACSQVQSLIPLVPEKTAAIIPSQGNRQVAGIEEKIERARKKEEEGSTLAAELERQTFSNERLAKENLDLQPVLEARKKELMDKCAELEKLKGSCTEKIARQHTLNESLCPETLSARLQVAILQSEEKSEQLAEQFLEGNLPAEQFICQYLDVRTLCHSRKAKEEHLSRLSTG
uniref:vacuolar protein sorting-associated protein 37A n=1 Tax=Myxine glutinosa TaxID=7769 RepID=UPI00358F49E8